MIANKCSTSISGDFLTYWESLGFFEYTSFILPQKFMLLFDIARIIETSELGEESFKVITDMCDESENRDTKTELVINRIDKSAPLGDRMELDRFRNIFDLKKALPRELASDEDIFEVKLFTKTLIVQRYFDTVDNFRYINTTKTGERDSNRFEQKFYLLLDRSRSMDKKMRFFYAKCLVTELLRRKLGSGARLYYRSFDSQTGELFRISDRNDFHGIIREILLTQTGGSRTDIQGAILQAIEDINFDSDMMHSEILMVTDGLSAIDKDILKSKLGAIKLNVVKIGDDRIDPSLSVIEKMLRDEKIDINTFDQDFSKHKDTNKTDSEYDKSEFNKQQFSQKNVIVNRFVQKYHTKLDKDLKEISYRFFDIKDIDMTKLYKLSEKQEEEITRAVKDVEEKVKKTTDQDDKVILYKKVHFLVQYISMLLEGSNENNLTLKALLERLYMIKATLLDDVEVYSIISEIPELLEDPKFMKKLGREAREKIKQISSQKQRLNSMQKKLLKLTRGGDTGQDIPGGLFALLIMLIINALKKVIQFPFKKKNI